MAAITGATATIGRAGKRKIGQRVRTALEASSQTFPLGALLIRDGTKNAAMGATSQAQSTGLIGLAASTGQNKSASGLATTPYVQFERDQPFKFTFSIASWIGSVHRGLTAGFYMDSAGSVVVKSGGASTCGTIIDAVEWDSGVAVADGDANPLVYFVVADAAIAQ